MHRQCQECRRLNPAEAAYCFYDGTPLVNGTGAAEGASIDFSTWAFPHPFVFPSGEKCHNFLQLALACHRHPEETIEALRGGFLAAFFSALGRVDLAMTSSTLAREPDADRALDGLLAKLPGSPLGEAKLEVEPLARNLGVLQVGEDRRFELTLSNKGERLVYGKATVEDCPWLVLGDSGAADKVFQFFDQAVIPVQVRGDRLRAYSKTQKGEIDVETNAGNFIVVVQVMVPVKPFAEGMLSGAASPRQVAEKAKANPREAAVLLENGAVARWYAANGWEYPVQGPTATGIAAVQQFFEVLGLVKTPKVELSEQAITLRGQPGERLEYTLTAVTQEKRAAVAHGVSDQPWLVVGKTAFRGQTASIPLIVEAVPNQPGQVLTAGVKVAANGGQRFDVPVTLHVDEGVFSGNGGGQWDTDERPVLESPVAAQTSLPTPLPIPIAVESPHSEFPDAPGTSDIPELLEPPPPEPILVPDPERNPPWSRPLESSEGACVGGGWSENDAIPPDAICREPSRRQPAGPESSTGRAGVASDTLMPGPARAPTDGTGFSAGLPPTRCGAPPGPMSEPAPGAVALAPPAPIRRRQWLFRLLPVGIVVLGLLTAVTRDALFREPIEEPLPEVDYDHPILDVRFHDVLPQGDFVGKPSMRFGLGITDPKDQSRFQTRLIFDEYGRTCNVCVRIDKHIEYLFGVEQGSWEGAMRQPLGKEKTSNRPLIGAKCVWVRNGPPPIAITQWVEIVPGGLSADGKKRLLDTCLVRYDITNRDKVPHSVALRFLLDTFIGSNDGVPFTIAGAQELCDTVKVFRRPEEVPDYISALERQDVKDPGIVAYLSLKYGGSLEPPTRVTLGAWPDARLRNIPGGATANLHKTGWEVPELSMALVKNPENPNGDSAVTMYWDDREVTPGKSRTVGFAYGLGSITGEKSGGQLGLTAGGELVADKEFTLTAYVKNPAPGTTITLGLPRGLELVAGRMTENVPAIPPGASSPYSPVTWRVRASRSGVRRVKVSLNSGATLTHKVVIRAAGFLR
jgi:hypothetical protein